MSPVNFQSNLTITHIGTATAILNIDGVNLLTDPVFCKAGTKHYVGNVVAKALGTSEEPEVYLESTTGPALELKDLPHIDTILLSHEDHADNLDPEGRTLLNGRTTVTTPDGARNLKPRPAHALRPWETHTFSFGGKPLEITGTPCQHIPGGEVTGFILSAPSFGIDPASGLPNAIYISGDTVYLPELAEMRKKWHIAAAIFNLGSAVAELPQGTVQITMDGKSAARLFRDIGADVLVPLHFEGWRHFTQFGDQLKKSLEEEGIGEKVCWLTPGVPKRVL
ncbi:beta-lactamase superfamily domain-containing protein [Macrophomina phaseolina]|uniref:Beta-lactamase superfamily domain-containing protein n=1 Tax=Macrophomina phaseolina TaxID=35725 RepID=A0ABQ8FTS9_9PEZI|nr:beta-lactamase superfamily domain-containing protein [Macrophomina phaseolina]KAH7026771.1 beta-lactamase superfamily domain-containing protein [Macrophomina phaseolina]